MLHPIFFIIFGLLLYLFYKEEDFSYKNLRSIFFFIVILMIIMAGGRDNVGADFPIYRGMYQFGFPKYTTYADIWNKATFQPNSMEIEWAYVLVNKIFFDLGLPYYMVTFFMASLSLSIFYSILTKYSSFVSFSFLYYFLPIYFIAECGQMRQGLGGAFVLLSIKFIIDRQLWKFLLVIFIGLGFHKSVIVFLPAYWIIKLPFSINKWLVLLVISVFLAPFQVYKYFGSAIESLAPADVSNAYTGYNNDTYYGNEMKTGFADAINIFFITLLLVYDKLGVKKVNYYEYFRNLAFFGFCLFYILRGNQIFATRLPGSYFAMAGYFLIPGILYAMNENNRRYLRFILLFYFLGFLILFSMGNAIRGNFLWNSYHNVLWSF